jgi:hypothetical protein
MGRWVDAAEAQHLAKISHLSITVRRAGGPGMPGDWPVLPDSVWEDSPTVVRALNSQQVVGYRLVKDPYGKPAFTLMVDMPRKIYQQGQASLFYFSLLVLTSGLVFGAMILFLLETLERSQEERIAERKRTEQLLVGEKHALEMITKGDSLDSVVGIVARTVEEQSAGIFCSILFVEPDGKTLRQVSAPSLPETYTRAIDKLTIGPSGGSLGMAAYTGKPVMISDIAHDPLWAEYRELALTLELRACWSVPIISTNAKVMGAIAVYCCESRHPNAAELDLIERAADLVAIATERKQVEQKLDALHAI